MNEGGKWLGRLIVPAIIVLVAAAAFGLGRLSAMQGQQGSLVIHPAATTSMEADLK